MLLVIKNIHNWDKMDMKAFCFNLVHGSIYGAEATTLIFSPLSLLILYMMPFAIINFLIVYVVGLINDKFISM